MVMNDMTDDGKWGAPIPIVDGKRPEWLENNLDIPIKTAAGWKGEVDYFDGDNAGWHWENITAIRLPASHPHYQQTQPATQTLTAQEHLARMEALVRKIATYTSREHHTSELLIAADEARALVAEMEPVVDGDLAEARNQLALHGWTSDDSDYHAAMDLAENCLKRGRELARGDVA